MNLDIFTLLVFKLLKLLAITENGNLLQNCIYLLRNNITAKHKFSIKTNSLIEEFQ